MLIINRYTDFVNINCMLSSEIIVMRVASSALLYETARDTPKNDGIASSFAMFLH